jgi:hypothetical protein
MPSLSAYRAEASMEVLNEEVVNTLELLTAEQLTQEQVAIPTLSKSELTDDLEYPVAETSISQALSTTSLLHDLNLRFFFGSDCNLRHGCYEFIRVEYLNDEYPAAKYPICYLQGRPPQSRWEIVVQPVPYMFRQEINHYILDVALPQIERWLDRRARLDQEGSEILSFFYNEREHAFSSESVSRLEPQRIRTNVIARLNYN